jgi:hypothetical protein
MVISVGESVHTSPDSLCSTLETVFKSLRSRCAFSPDTCGSKAYPQKMFADTNASGYVWTGLESISFP